MDADPRTSSRRPAGRLWETALHPESIRTRLDYFNNTADIVSVKPVVGGWGG